jgi:glycosyltransferase involved in cell wall biosynthesis
MNRILLIGNYPPDRQHSMLRYSEWLRGILSERGFEAELFQPVSMFEKLAKPNHPAQKLLGYIDKFLVFPVMLLARAGGYDLMHICDHTNAPYRLFARGIPVAVTCHDMIGIKGMLGEFDRPRPRWSGRLLQKWVLSSLRKIRFSCCVSENTSDDLKRLAPCADRRCRVIPNPVIGFSPMASGEAEHELRSAGINPDAPFFLSIGNNIWHKNRAGMLRIFAETLKRPQLADMQLICAGAGLSTELKNLSSELGIASRVREVVFPSNSLIRALYSRATALLFVSLYEGFGWPIVEAQACGCPVITSNREPMTSIAGEPAVIVDPALPAEAARTISDRWQWMKSQSDASIRNASRFSQERATDDYVAFFRDALKETANGPLGFASTEAP